MKKIVILLLILLSGVILTSCQDDPASVGSSLIPPEDHLVTDSLDNSQYDFGVRVSTFNQDSVDYGSSMNLLLGNYKNIKSSVLVKYYLFLADSIEASVDEFGNGLTVIDSWIEFSRTYEIGEESAPFDFNVYQINEKSWYTSYFNADSMNALNEYIDYTTDVKSGAITVTDSTVVFPLNNDVALDWIRNAVSDTLADNEGLFITPTAGTGKLLGFSGLSSSNIENLSTLYMVVQNAGAFTDTIVASVTSDVHYAEWSEPETHEQRFVLQGGIPKRSSLYFNVDNLSNDIIVNNATLKLYYDEELSDIGEPVITSLYAGMLADSTTNDIASNYGIIQLTKGSDGNYFEGDISTFVQYWQIGLNNEGLKIYIANDYTIASKLVLYGPDSTDPSLRPEIKIIYTSQR